MSISFAVKKTPLPPAPEWVSVFDNTYWQNQSNSFWNGSQWIDFAEEGMSLKPVGEYSGSPNYGWEVGFRPSKIRITGTVTFDYTTDLRYASGFSDLIGQATSPVTSPAVFDLDWSEGQDLLYLVLSVWTPVTNIEFLGGTLGSS